MAGYDGWSYRGDFIIKWQDNQLIGHLNDNDSYRIRVKTYYLEMLKNKANLKPEEYDFVKKGTQFSIDDSCYAICYKIENTFLIKDEFNFIW